MTFPKINDHHIVLHDQEAAKRIIAVNADLDGAIRLLNKLIDQSKALLPPGQKALGLGVLVRACVRGDRSEACEGVLGHNSAVSAASRTSSNVSVSAERIGVGADGALCISAVRKPKPPHVRHIDCEFLAGAIVLPGVGGSLVDALQCSSVHVRHRWLRMKVCRTENGVVLLAVNIFDNLSKGGALAKCATSVRKCRVSTSGSVPICTR
jgi:hypothetical protein